MHASRPEDVSPLERCPHFRECYVQASGPEDVSPLERCPHSRGCYVHTSMGLGPENRRVLCTGFNRVVTCIKITLERPSPLHAG